MQYTIIMIHRDQFTNRPFHRNNELMESQAHNHVICRDSDCTVWQSKF